MDATLRLRTRPGTIIEIEGLGRHTFEKPAFRTNLRTAIIAVYHLLTIDLKHSRLTAYELERLQISIVKMDLTKKYLRVTLAINTRR